MHLLHKSSNEKGGWSGKLSQRSYAIEDAGRRFRLCAVEMVQPVKVLAAKSNAPSSIPDPTLCKERSNSWESSDLSWCAQFRTNGSQPQQPFQVSLVVGKYTYNWSILTVYSRFSQWAQEIVLALQEFLLTQVLDVGQLYLQLIDLESETHPSWENPALGVAVQNCQQLTWPRG